MSAQMKDLVAELLNQGYAFDDIKNEIDAQIKAREDEAKRVQEETVQKQKIEAADQLVADVLAFLIAIQPQNNGVTGHSKRQSEHTCSWKHP